MKKLYFAILFCIIAISKIIAQGDNGAIKITLRDKNSQETLPFANVVAFKDGIQVAVATTNIDGEAIIKPLAPGRYNVKGVFVGYKPTEIKDVIVKEGATAYITLPLVSSTELEVVEVIAYQVPLIDPDTKSGQGYTREEYQNLAVKDINSVASTAAGVFQADEGKGLNIRGGRDVSTTYFVDGIKVFGTPRLPQNAIEQLNVITGGVPASYGDLTAGAISISTRGPQSKYVGSVELVTSQLTDKFGYNLLGFSVGGPMLKKHDSTRRTILGFFISGQGNYLKDPSPSFVPIQVLKDDKLQELKDNPLRQSPSGTGYIRNSEFVTKDDMKTQRFRPNAVQRILALQGKIDYQPTLNTNVTFGGYYEYVDNFNAGVGNQIFNSANNSKTTNSSYRGSISVTQKFGKQDGDKDKTQTLLKNSFFKFQASYEYSTSVNQDANHKDNIFKYNYVGKFSRSFSDENFAYNYLYAPGFNVNGQATNSFTYTQRSELPVKFEASSLNPDAAIYTQYVMDNYNPITNESRLNLQYIQSVNGLINGDNPQSIYSLYNNFGAYPTGRVVQNISQLRFVTSFNTDIKNHAISVGLEFDQRVSSYFQYSGGIWQRMRDLANVHTRELDKSTPILNQNLSGLIPYYYFNYQYQKEKQTQFSEQLLYKLGLPQNYTGFVNTDEYDPSMYSLDMFSAEDLLGAINSANLVDYRGYSHDGKKVGGKTNINDFLTKVDANNRKTFPIGDFKPIYSSVYLMDKFDFKDMKFLVGLRVDRYDANQPVLKDKYALHELAKVSDLASLPNLPLGFADNVPKNIDEDAAVYVAQNPTGGKSPISIKGYRVKDQWYNSEGNEISDPNLIASSDSKPIPLYKDNANYEKNMSAGAFTNYLAAVNVMPRLAFSFPISDVANFFAHYDILTQRPFQSGISPLDFYFLSAASTVPTLNNPNMRPQQKVDYEFGFSQVLNERKSVVLKISTFYNEFRNLLNQKVVVGAYPKNYITFDNIDFQTSKGLQLELDYRRTNGSRFTINYSLMFAEGSGSNANSGANLANSGTPNLRVTVPLDYDQRHSFAVNYDYRFGTKKEYKGPTFKTKSRKTGEDKKVEVFGNMGINLSFLLGSGTPYTRWSGAVPLNGGSRSNIVGQINGSSKPWTFRTNMRIDKIVPLTFGKEDSDNKKNANLNIYLQVLNLFDTRNVIDVYRYTGLPDDDGYLASTQAQAALRQTNSPISFTDLYNIRSNSLTNFSLPRQIRIGVLFEF